ncbi:MAG: rRNA methyltransferase [Burkholderiales bacterium RIFCSPLOWO2_12_FULL_64_99]|jgi:tRNA/rRNA methyltransferase|uniref:RNA methyltransferase n=1 Tax=Aquabacterium sp. TaxID=1872578 RepID=UPI0008C31DA0|nr:RNA methyltransferase [Aquabacterium sp.]OGB02109.1 MAG: rRNA methyltransferase [Burkholderiales bacterium RIFCSPHIGHO2_12_FULL_63_20]OGB68029.1 MAG: rRNA methyltransferase [Burkholderiales bacterium RIFCSPLOWO2_12_FULL_64_99]
MTVSTTGSAGLGTDPTRFILIGTSHPGNVGATARAMKVMGFSDLVLVRPRFADVLSQEETVALASGAADILVRARIVDTLAEALDGVTYAIGTAMTPRDFGPPTLTPREGLAALARQEPAQRVGFVFGSERYGMANEDVYRCHAVISIPTNPHYGSLNLSQAVQLLSYEWRQALGGFPVQARTPSPDLADGQAVQGALSHWEQALVALGFLDPKAPKKLMPRLNQLLNRAELRQEEIHVLRGIAKAILDRCKQ